MNLCNSIQWAEEAWPMNMFKTEVNRILDVNGINGVELVQEIDIEIEDQP